MLDSTQVYNYIERYIDSQRGEWHPPLSKVVHPVIRISLPEVTADVSAYLYNNLDVFAVFPDIINIITQMTGTPETQIESDYEDPTKKYLIFKCIYKGPKERWLDKWEGLSEKVYEKVGKDAALKIHVILEPAHE